MSLVGLPQITLVSCRYTMLGFLPTHNFVDVSSQVIMLLYSNVTFRLDFPQPYPGLALNHYHRVAIPEEFSAQHISMTPASRDDDTPVLNLPLISEAFNLLWLFFFLSEYRRFSWKKGSKNSALIKISGFYFRL